MALAFGDNKRRIHQEAPAAEIERAGSRIAKRARTGRLVWRRDGGPSRKGWRLVHLGSLLVLIVEFNTLRRSP